MIEFIKELKMPDKVDIKTIRKYNDVTPSATGLLSLIDSYELDNKDALNRGTAVHNFMEEMIGGKDISLTSYSEDYIKFIGSTLPYINELKNAKGKLYLEQKLIIEGVMGGTIDYNRIDLAVSYLKDYKTTLKLTSISKELLKKYDIQMRAYRELIYFNFKVHSINGELMFISEEGAMFIKSETQDVTNKLLILILYYHTINGSINSKEIIKFFRKYVNTLDLIYHISSKEKIKQLDILQKGTKILLDTLIIKPNKNGTNQKPYSKRLSLS